MAFSECSPADETRHQENDIGSQWPRRSSRIQIHTNRRRVNEKESDFIQNLVQYFFIKPSKMVLGGENEEYMFIIGLRLQKKYVLLSQRLHVIP